MKLAGLLLGLMSLRVPDGLGVNIHFTDPRPGEMKMLAASGAKWVRMDFNWAGIEREKGKYDFSAYDRLMAALKPYGIHALFILDYSNNLYDAGQSPNSDEGRQAFAAWAAAAARHFKGQGILWEMYNEPNIGFWRPKPNADDYTKLALAVGKALRAAEPGEVYIGPATSGIDMRFLEACFKAGLLDYWAAVSVHPYRQSNPETAADEYRRLRLLIARYAPRGKRIPIISGEWGYSSVWGGMTEELQGKRLARQWLTNLSNDVPVSIWYDWHDDGLDPKEPEHHFGTTLNPYHEGRDPVYDPKPAYIAARTLTTALGGYRFNKRLALGSPTDYVLLFSKGNAVRLAAWTTGPEPHEVTIPASPGAFHVTDHLGQARPDVAADSRGLVVQVSDAPVYLVPDRPNDLLRLAAAWDRLPLEVVSAGDKPLVVRSTARNPLSRPLRGAVMLAWSGAAPNPPAVTLSEVRPGGTLTAMEQIQPYHSAESGTVGGTLQVEGAPVLAQETALVASRPLGVTVLPSSSDRLTVRVENPTGSKFHGALRVDQPGPTSIVPVDVAQGATEEVLTVQGVSAVRPGQPVTVSLLDTAGSVVVRTTTRFVQVADFAPGFDLQSLLRVVPDGDAAVASEQTIAVGRAPGRVPGGGNARALRLDYRFDAGWKFARVTPQTPALAAIQGKPRALGMWLYGDGQANLARLRFTDSGGQTFQPGGPAVDWKGWRWVTFPLDGTDAGHWGGADDGVVRYPIHFDSLFLLDSATRAATQGTVYIAAPTLIY